MTSHCRAATAFQLTRGYQGDYRRQSLTSVATREPPQLDRSFHISTRDWLGAVNTTRTFLMALKAEPGVRAEYGSRG